MNKQISYKHDARMKIKAGIDKAAEAVKPTLGVIGLTAMIEFPGLEPIECDDGVTILKNLEFADKYENLGLSKIRTASVRTSTEGGDGTATTAVLTDELINAAFKEISNDSSKIREVRERLQGGLEEIMGQLGQVKRDVTKEEVEKIARISSLDEEVAKLMAEIIEEVGVNGVVTVEKGAQLGYSKEIVKGVRFDSGLISPYFINEPETNSTVLNDPHIILIDRVVSTNEQILGLINSIGTGSDILIIADDGQSVALGTLAQNAANKIANIACVKNPYSASRAREFLTDISCLTGATVLSEEKGMKLDEATKEVCGRAEKVVVTRDNTTLIGGKESEALKHRIKNITHEIKETTSEYDKEILNDRLAQLTGGIGVIRVGSYTDNEFNAKKYKFVNAINATQASLQEGIVPGGGVALAKISIEDPLFDDFLVAPLKQMAINAGMDFYKVVNDVREGKEGWGYDFRSKDMVNMIGSGIIDPFKVTRLAVESAVAVASSLCAIDVAIVNEDETEE